MSKKIQSIIWISKDIPESLIETIKKYQDSKIKVDLLVSSNSTKKIEGVKHINKEELYQKIINKTNNKVPKDVIEFALFSKDFLKKINTIDTGTHRNAAILSTVGQKFIFSDDDVLCQFHKIKNNERKIKLDMNDIRTRYFENKNILDLTIDYKKELNLKELIDSHEYLLNLILPEKNMKVLSTMTGVHGESVSDTPKGLLRRIHTKNKEDLYKEAKINRLLLSYSENYLIRKKPHFVSMYSAFNNEEILPPFFPIARNQDGIFAAAMMACMPNSMIGQVPWVAKHQPFPARNYKKGEISNYRFKLNTLIVSLLNSYSKSEYTNKKNTENLNIGDNRYKEVGEYLEKFANKNNDDFINFIQKYISTNIDKATLSLGKFLVSNNNYSEEWQRDIRKYLLNAQEYKKSSQFGIPHELINENRSFSENIELTKSLISMYGKLLKHWPEIVNSMKK